VAHPTLLTYLILLWLFPTDGWESASLSEEEEEDGEWVDVHHSSDEEQQAIVSPYGFETAACS
jgi:hypothetical protein